MPGLVPSVRRCSGSSRVTVVAREPAVIDVVGEVEHDACGVHTERGGDQPGVGGVDQVGQAGAAQHAG